MEAACRRSASSLMSSGIGAPDSGLDGWCRGIANSRRTGGDGGCRHLFLRGHSPSLFTPVFHQVHAERLFGRELVVGSAAQAQVLDRGLASSSDFEHVIELQHLAGFASMPALAHERAAATIAP